MTELTAVKCNECEARAFLEDEGSPEWATCIITVPGPRIKVTVHYCPPCRDRLFDKIGDPRERLNTAQHRVIDPAAPNRELEAAIGQVNPEIDDRNDRDLERLGVPSPPRGIPVVPPDEVRGPRVTNQMPAVTQATAAVPDPTEFWRQAPAGDGGTALGGRTRTKLKGARTRGRKKVADAVRGAATTPRLASWAPMLVPLLAVMTVLR